MKNELVIIGIDSESLLTLAAGGTVDLPHLNLRIIPSGNLARLQHKIKVRINGSIRIQPVPAKKDLE